MSSIDSSTLVSNQSSIHYSRGNRRAFEFRHGKSTVDQVTLLTQDIVDSISANKTRAVFVDLTAAYETVWHRGLIYKFIRLLPDMHMVRMITEWVRNRSFALTTGNIKRSRLRHLEKGVPQGSVL